LELIPKLREKFLNVPIIAISGGTRIATINFLPHAKIFGASRVFEKPVALKDLLQAVKELLDESG
jgi:FixJ family two-component response regulator